VWQFCGSHLRVSPLRFRAQSSPADVRPGWNGSALDAAHAFHGDSTKPLFLRLRLWSKLGLSLFLLGHSCWCSLVSSMSRGGQLHQIRPSSPPSSAW